MLKCHLMNEPCSSVLQKKETLKVLYDGECPMCRIEIEHIRQLANKNPDSGLCFIDITSHSAEAEAYSSDKKVLLERFHVEYMDGTRVDGAKAFVTMWDRLPGWHWLAKFSKFPGLLVLMELAYKGFLKIRPSLQSALRRRMKQ